MAKKETKSIIDLLLEAHDRAIELAIDTSIRTGVPLVVEKDGKIFEIPPQYKYVRVPIKNTKKNLKKQPPKPKKKV